MPARQYRLLTLSQAYTIVDRMATTHQCSHAAIRVLALLNELDTAFYRVGIADVIKVLACHYDTAEIGLREGVRLGWLTKTHKRHVYYVPTAAGIAVADSLRKEERAMNLAAIKLEPTKKRKYIKRVATNTTK